MKREHTINWITIVGGRDFGIIRQCIGSGPSIKCNPVVLEVVRRTLGSAFSGCQYLVDQPSKEVIYCLYTRALPLFGVPGNSTKKGRSWTHESRERTSFGLQFLELRPFYIHVQNLAERRRANTENNLDTSSVVVKGHGLYRRLSQTNANCTEWMPSSYPRY